jgi:hypothetical protein
MESVDQSVSQLTDWLRHGTIGKKLRERNVNYQRIIQVLHKRLTTFFNLEKFCVLPTQRLCVFRMVLTIKSDCFPKHL